LDLSDKILKSRSPSRRLPTGKQFGSLVET
jgi:hypothetical protein